MHRTIYERVARALFGACLAFYTIGCGGSDRRSSAPDQAEPAPARVVSSPDKHDPDGIYIPAYEQRPGDPAQGYRALLGEGYVGCGMPWSVAKGQLKNLPDHLKLPDRPGSNADAPYHMNVFTTTGGVEVVSSNCLTCHADTLNGEVVIGLGNIHSNFANVARLPPAAMGFMLAKPERAEFTKWRSRFLSLTDYVQTLTIGVNPADNITAVLFAHRDPKTLAWSDKPVIPMPRRYVVPVDVPPWWHMSKKHALYYTASGKRDHSRLMMLASVVCVDTIDHARQIDAYFPHIRAYIASLKPPVYTGSIDRQLAEQGKSVFEDVCSECHGTYGPNGSYPNRVLRTEEIGTDPMLAQGSAFYHGRFVDWFKQSFYGEISQLAPEPGYIAPPLDGIWATAPYFHNGSVPTVAGVLESASRPSNWRRLDDYDHANLGWRYEKTSPQAEAPEDSRSYIYDTRNKGYANTGHTFGDDLAPDDRKAVIEYLKTL